MNRNDSMQRGENMPLLSVKNLSKSYGRLSVLEKVTFDARAGEALALWGKNGAGKTTLLKSILGLANYTGEISVDGYRPDRQGKQVRRLIGYVPQEAVFYDMTVRNTIVFYARLKNAELSGIRELIERLGLLDHLEKSVTALSGGLKQRLALVIALLSDPPILLLDEPTANLDAQTRFDYIAELKHMRSEHRLIIFSSHRVEEVEALADRVMVVEIGKPVEEISPAELRYHVAPEVELTFWVPGSQRPGAIELLCNQGMQAVENGRGTVVVTVPAVNKLVPFNLLAEHGIRVEDFEMEQVRSWNRG